MESTWLKTLREKRKNKREKGRKGKKKKEFIYVCETVSSVNNRGWVQIAHQQETKDINDLTPKKKKEEKKTGNEKTKSSY